jgi:hypothetical protein
VRKTEENNFLKSKDRLLSINTQSIFGHYVLHKEGATILLLCLLSPLAHAESFVRLDGRMKCDSKTKSCRLVVNPNAVLSENTYLLKSPGKTGDFFSPSLDGLDLEISGTLHEKNVLEVYGFKDIILNLAVGQDNDGVSHR